MERQEVIERLKGLRSEHMRKSDEIWARGLEHGYDCENEHGKTAQALQIAIEALEKEGAQ